MSPTSGERFPHVYGRIGQDAIVAVHPYVPVASSPRSPESRSAVFRVTIKCDVRHA